MIKVQKRDGQIVDFDITKIENAIAKAFDSVNKNYSKEDKIALHNGLVDYFKTIADDGKVYNLYLDEEYDKADTEASGIWIRATINSKKCKIYFYKKNTKELNKEHTQEMLEFKEDIKAALNNNTMALNKLCEKLEKVGVKNE